MQLKCLPFTQDKLSSQFFVYYEIRGSREDRIPGTGVIRKLCFCCLYKAENVTKNKMYGFANMYWWSV